MTNNKRNLPRPNSAPYIHLFSAYYEGGKAKGKLAPIANTLLIVVDSSSEQDRAEKPILWATDHRGALHAVEPKTLELRNPVHAISNKRFIIPPPEMVSFIKQQAAADRNEKEWLSILIKEFKAFLPSECIQDFKIEPRSFSDLKKPKESNKNDPYSQWYASLNDKKKILAHISPRIRAMLCVANKSLPINFLGTIRVYQPNHKLGQFTELAWLSQPFSDYMVAVLNGTALNLPGGIFKFQVSLDTAADLKPWNHLIANPEDGATPTYTLAEMVRFNIINTAGEFSIVSLDPISLEESLITQYARCYAHLLSLVSSHNPTLKIDDANSVARKDAKISDKTSVKSPGFFQFAKMWAVTKSAAELAAGIPMIDLGREFQQGSNRVSVNGQVDFANQIGKALHTHLEGAENEAVRNSLNAYFAFKDGRSAFENLYNTRSTYGRTMTHYGSWAEALQPRLVNLPPQLREIRQYRRSLAGRYGIPYRHMMGFNAVLSYVNLSESAVALSKETFKHFSKTLPAVNDAKEKFMAVAQSYYDLLKERDVEASISLRGLFAFNSHQLRDDVKSSLADVTSHIINLLDMQKDLHVYIGGHTCDIGSFEANKKLSQDRADAVKDFLVQKGVEAERIIAIGHSYIDPVAHNDSEDNRKKNRRVVIQVEAEGKSLITPSREGMGTLERFRTVLTQQEITKDKAEKQLALQTLNVALGVLSCTPLTAVAARAVIFAIEGTKATINLVSALDKMFAQGALNSIHDNLERAKLLQKESNINQMHLYDLFECHQDVQAAPDNIKWTAQFRIRAEVLGGLIHLLQRACFDAVSILKDITYEEALEKYAVREYVENFILKDEWLYPIEGAATLDMATYWMYAVNNYNNTREDYDTKAVQYGMDENNKVLPKEALEKVIQTVEDRMKKSQKYQSGYSDLHGVYYMTHYDRTVDKHIKAAFHKMFPVHYFGALSGDATGASKKKDLFDQFADMFRPVIKHVKKADIEYTRIYYKDDKTKQWVPFATEDQKFHSTRGAKRSRNYKPFIPKTVTPMTPIRVLIVFKKEEDLPSVFPLRFRVDRVDGINVEGPVYKTIAKPLSERDLTLPEEQDYVGHHGCVFHPFFQVWDKTYFGIKPLINKPWLKRKFDDIHELYDHHDLGTMRYEIKCRIADNLNDVRLPLKSVKDGHGIIYTNRALDHHVYDEIPVAVNAKESVQIAMLDEQFLISNTTTFDLPPLFKGGQRAQLAIQVGGEGPYVNMVNGRFDLNKIADANAANAKVGLNMAPESDDVLRFRTFNWREPVKFLATFSIAEVKKENYKDKPADWRKITCYATMFSDVHSTIDWNWHEGPTLKGSMVFLGQLTVKNAKLVKYDDEEVDLSLVPDSELQTFEELVDLLQQVNRQSLSEEEYDDLLAYFGNPVTNINTDKHLSNSWYIYAATFDCSYHSRKGREIKSIRPFGKDLIEAAARGKEDYLEYHLRNFGSAGNSGLKIEKAQSLGRSGRLTVEPRFDFRIPGSFTAAGLPWTRAMDKKELERLKDINYSLYERYSSSELSPTDAKKWLDEDAKKTGNYFHEAVNTEQ